MASHFDLKTASPNDLRSIRSDLCKELKGMLMPFRHWSVRVAAGVWNPWVGREFLLTFSAQAWIEIARDSKTRCISYHYQNHMSVALDFILAHLRGCNNLKSLYRFCELLPTNRLALMCSEVR